MVNDLQSCATLISVRFDSGSFALLHDVAKGAKGRVKVSTSARIEFQRAEGLDRGEEFYLVTDMEYAGFTEQGEDNEENKTFSVQCVARSKFASNCDNFVDLEKFTDYIPELFDRVYPFIRGQVIGIIDGMGLSAPGIPWNLNLRPDDALTTDASAKREVKPRKAKPSVAKS